MINWKGYVPDLIPLFWRYTDDSVHKVLTAAEDSLKDLFQDVETRYKALAIETCEDYKPELLRPMYLYMLTDDDGRFPEAQWKKFKEYQKKFFRDRYFIYPESPDPGTLLWKSIQEITDCTALYNGITVTKDTGYFWIETPDGGGPGTIVFKTNPFDVFLGRWTETEITAPWKRTYRCRRLVLWVSGLNMSESVMETHYADLISTPEVIDMFRDDGALSAFVYNFYRTLYRGATQMSIAAFVNSLAGYDYIKSDYETVGTWGVSYDPETGTELNRWLLTDKNKYYLPFDVNFGRWVKPGAVLPKYTPLARLLDVYSYDEDPDWIFDPTTGAAGYLEGVITTRGGVPGATDNPFFMFAAEQPNPPRFDLCRQLERRNLYSQEGNPVNHFQTLEEGLWHNLVGRNIVYVVFRDQELYEKYCNVIYDLLLEVVPIHVHCIVDYELDGWFFYDPELTDETGVTWFADEDFKLIEDPEQTDKLYYELSIYHPMAADAPDGEGNIFEYQDTVEVIGRAPSGSKIRMWLIDSDSTHAPHTLTDLETGLQILEIVGDGLFKFSFKITEDFAPRNAVLKLECIQEEETEMPERYATAPIRIVPHALWFTSIPGHGDTPAYALQNYAYTLSGRADENASEGLSVTLTWPHRAEPVPGETIYSVTVQLDHNHEFQYTIPGGDEDQPPVGVYEVRAEIVNGTRDRYSAGEERFTNTPAAVEINCLPTIFHLDTSTQYRGAGLRNDVLLDFPLQPVTPDNTVVIRTPHSGDRLYIGTTTAVMGLATFDDGTEVRLYKTVDGTDTLIGITTALNRRFLFDWPVIGDDGQVSIKAVCGNAEASVDVTLAIVLAIDIPVADSPITADIPMGYRVRSSVYETAHIQIDDLVSDEITFIDGVAEGTLTVSGEQVTLGTIFKVTEGGEVQISDTMPVVLTCIGGSRTESVNLILKKADNNFIMTPSTAAVSWRPGVQQQYETSLTATTSASGWKPERNDSNETNITAATSASGEVVTD